LKREERRDKGDEGLKGDVTHYDEWNG